MTGSPRSASDEFLASRRRALEDAFFHQRDAQLLQRMRDEARLEARCSELQNALGIGDVAVAEHLAKLEVNCASISALSLVPLIRVAWSDGRVAPRQRKAILAAVVHAGLDQCSTSFECLQGWLDAEPDAGLTQLWREYIEALWPLLPARDRQSITEGILTRAKEVAEASGGILGLGNKISAAEQKVLDQIAAELAVRSSIE